MHFWHPVLRPINSGMTEMGDLPGRTAPRRGPYGWPVTLETLRNEWLPLIKRGAVERSARHAHAGTTGIVLRPMVLALAARMNEILHDVSLLSVTADRWAGRTDIDLHYLSQGIADLCNPASYYGPNVEGIIEGFERRNSFVRVFDLWTGHLACDTFLEGARAAVWLNAIAEHVASNERRQPNAEKR